VQKKQKNSNSAQCGFSVMKLPWNFTDERLSSGGFIRKNSLRGGVPVATIPSKTQGWVFHNLKPQAGDFICETPSSGIFKF
jgi:hypothetical protein